MKKETNSLWGVLFKDGSTKILPYEIEGSDIKARHEILSEMTDKEQYEALNFFKEYYKDVNMQGSIFEWGDYNMDIAQEFIDRQAK